MGRTRVLELIKSLDVGGAEVLLLERLLVSNHKDFDYRVGYLDGSRRDLVSRIESAVPVHCFDSRSGRDWRWVRRLRTYLVAEGIEVVNVHSPLMAVGVRAAVRSIPADSRPRLITTEHNVKHHPLTQALDRTTVWMDDLVIAVSGPVSSAPVAQRARRVVVVNHGVNVADQRANRSNRIELAEQFGIDVSLPTIVSIANFRSNKGHERMLDAAKKLHERNASFHFYVAGQGPLEAWVRNEVVVRQMSDYYTVLGRVPQASRLAACADIFVLASDWEGRPVSLMEAMAAGAACIASAVGGVPEMVETGVNGILIDPTVPGSLASALELLLMDPQLVQDLGANAMEEAQRFDMTQTAIEIEGLYTELNGHSG